MFARASIVLLLVLNLGVALWWWTRDAPPVAPAREVPMPGASLELLSPATAAVDVVPEPVETPNADTRDEEAVDARQPLADAAHAADLQPGPEPVIQGAAAMAGKVPLRCHALGPFVDRNDADAALARVRAQVSRADLRAVEGRPDRWRVLTPAVGDDTAARTLAARLTTAGFSDHYVMAGGADAGGSRLALGRFSSEQAARNHQAALRAAGFPGVLVEAEGEAASRYWIDVMVAADTDVATLRRASLASRANAIDCPAPR